VEGDILQEVSRQIHQIEKDKFNSNYDGKLRELTCQYIFEQEEICCLGRDTRATASVFVAGDRTGNVMFFDTNKKAQICKKELTPGKRITSIAVTQAELGPFSVTTIAVAARGEPCVLLYRIKKGENRFYHLGSIPLADKPGPDSATDNFPCTCEFSLQGEFLAVTCYSGRVLIYKVPDPPAPKKEANKIREEEGEED
jgi:hypothetical protein